MSPSYITYWTPEAVSSFVRTRLFSYKWSKGEEFTRRGSKLVPSQTCSRVRKIRSRVAYRVKQTRTSPPFA